MKNKKISLQEQLELELKRYNSINLYTQKLVFEQELPPEGDDQLPPPAEGGEAPPAADQLTAIDPTNDLGAEAPPEGEEEPVDGVDNEIPADTGADDSTEEIDITDLVNMTKNIKQELENKQDNSGDVIAKMDGVFQKLGELEGRLSNMDQIFQRIDQLSGEIQQMKPPTPQEKLEMRSLDSGPFKEKPSDFFNTKKAEMERSGKNEYVLTSDDVKNYSKNEIMKSFNADLGQEDY